MTDTEFLVSLFKFVLKHVDRTCFVTFCFYVFGSGERLVGIFNYRSSYSSGV